jgi:hypothetical protein
MHRDGAGGWRCAVANRARKLTERDRARRRIYSPAERERRRVRSLEARHLGLADARREIIARGGACADCGRPYEHDLPAGERLEWHHRDPATKVFSIADSWRYDEVARTLEQAKCVLLCRRCHLDRHWAL